MSGQGKRFKKYGYRVTKPLIEINKKPMIFNACETFPKSKNWNFIINKKDDKNNRINNLIKKIDSNANIIQVNKITNGPASDFVFHDGQEMLSPDELDSGYTLTCVAYPISDLRLETSESP